MGESSNRGRCVICQRIGQGEKDFICEDCGHPEKTMLVCRCGKRQDLTPLGPESIMTFLQTFSRGADWAKSSAQDIHLGITFFVPSCYYCSNNNDVSGEALVYRIRRRKEDKNGIENDLK